jgi:hypothetical protein
LLAEYREIRSDFRTLTDIRFKLLALLPIASGVVAAFHVELDSSTGIALYLFGLAITLGLVTYNARNDQLYDELVGRAAEIERRLGLPDGAFANRPCPWLTLNIGRVRWNVGHGPAIQLIYASSAALWIYGVLEVAGSAAKDLWIPPTALRASARPSIARGIADQHAFSGLALLLIPPQYAHRGPRHGLNYHVRIASG